VLTEVVATSLVARSLQLCSASLHQACGREWRVPGEVRLEMTQLSRVQPVLRTLAKALQSEL
jgi:hypothetical protein